MLKNQENCAERPFANHVDSQEVLNYMYNVQKKHRWRKYKCIVFITLELTETGGIVGRLRK